MLIVSESMSHWHVLFFFAIVMNKGICYGNQVTEYACPSVAS